MKIRKYIQFYGKVQGVGFRYHATYRAKFLGLTGWVRNCSDGSVEMEVQGKPELIDDLLLYLRKQAKYTLMVTISMLPVSEGLSTPWPVILAGTTLVIIPIIMLYLVLQTFQKAGMMMGAVKG